MLLPGVLFALFLAGCWLCCLADAALTPACEYLGWSKRTWIVVIAVTFIVGSIAWVLTGRHARARYWPSTAADHLEFATLDDVNVLWYPHHPTGGSAEPAPTRHPAGRSRTAGHQMPRGPDDDPEFLRQLARRIHGDPQLAPGVRSSVGPARTRRKKHGRFPTGRPPRDPRPHDRVAVLYPRAAGKPAPAGGGGAALTGRAARA